MMLQIEGLKKSYGERPVLHGIDLQVAAGEIVALIGNNGAGKTTMASIVAGLLSPDSGRVTVAGVDARRYPIAARERLGLAPQEVGLYPSISGFNNLRFFGRLAGLRKLALNRRIDELVQRLELGEFIHKRVESISGGQARRIHTAVALLHRPAVLWLDEPTVGADVQSRMQLLAEIRRFATEGSAVVYATHYFPEAESLGASVAVLFEGKIVANGSIERIVHDHALPTIEMTFDGLVPQSLQSIGQSKQEEGTTRVVVPVQRPSQDLARLIAALGEGASRLRSVELRQPTLESAFLSITRSSLAPAIERIYAVA